MSKKDKNLYSNNIKNYNLFTKKSDIKKERKDKGTKPPKLTVLGEVDVYQITTMFQTPPDSVENYKATMEDSVTEWCMSVEFVPFQLGTLAGFGMRCIVEETNIGLFLIELGTVMNTLDDLYLGEMDVSPGTAKSIQVER